MRQYRKTGTVCTLLTFAACISASKTCDRGRSALARAIIHQVVLPHIEWSNSHLPGECVLHPDRDMYAAVENAKLKKSGHYECDSCGKKELSSEHLDDHVHEHHRDLAEGGGDVCLADLCDVLHCDYLATKMDLDGTHQHRKYDENAVCDPVQTLALRRQCNAITHDCFVPEVPNAHLVYDFMRNDFCGAHVCDMKERHELLTRIAQGHHRKRWIFYVTAISAACAVAVLFIGFYIYERLTKSTLSIKEWKDIALLREYNDHKRQMATKHL